LIQDCTLDDCMEEWDLRGKDIAPLPNDLENCMNHSLCNFYRWDEVLKNGDQKSGSHSWITPQVVGVIRYPVFFPTWMPYNERDLMVHKILNIFTSRSK